MKKTKIRKQASAAGGDDGRRKNGQQGIAEWLEKVRFRKRLLGGVDEADVWKKLEELTGLYRDAIKAERTRYCVLLERQKEEMLRALDEKAAEGRAQSGPEQTSREDL